MATVPRGGAPVLGMAGRRACSSCGCAVSRWRVRSGAPPAWPWRAHRHHRALSPGLRDPPGSHRGCPWARAHASAGGGRGGLGAAHENGDQAAPRRQRDAPRRRAPGNPWSGHPRRGRFEAQSLALADCLLPLDNLHGLSSDGPVLWREAAWHSTCRPTRSARRFAADAQQRPDPPVRQRRQDLPRRSPARTSHCTTRSLCSTNGEPSVGRPEAARRALCCSRAARRCGSASSDRSGASRKTSTWTPSGKNGFEAEIEELFQREYHGLRFHFANIRYSDEENFSGTVEYAHEHGQGTFELQISYRMTIVLPTVDLPACTDPLPEHGSSAVSPSCTG